MRILQTDQQGFHNRFTAGRCLVAVVEGTGAAAGPLQDDIAAPLRAELAVAETELAELLGAAELSAPPLVSGLAAALQRAVYDKPWRHGALRAKDGDFGLFLECADFELARLCLSSALRLTEVLVSDTGETSRSRAAELRKLLAEHRRKQHEVALHPTTREVIAEAEARDIPWRRIGGRTHHYVMGQGERFRRLRGYMCDLDSILGAEISHNKLLTSRILVRSGLPVPQAASVASADDAVAVAKQIGFPVVVKPNALLKGIGVATDLATEEEVRAAYDSAAVHGVGVNVERMIRGDDHRILIVAGRFIAAVRREPARVIGDGRSSLRELIDRENENPLRQDNHHLDLLTQILPDAETDRLLARAGLTLDSVPDEGQVVQVKATANIASGGTAVDVTDSIHPDNVAMARRAAQLIDVDVAGIDYITTDISRSFRETEGAICEVNTWISLAPHRAALPKRDVISPLVDRIFPPGDNGRIPIAVVCGDSTRNAVAERLAAILNASGRCCGEATETGARVGGTVIARGDHANYRGADILLNDPACQAVAQALELRNFVARGLPFDRCTAVAVIGYAKLEEAEREAARRLAAVASDAVILEASDEAAAEMQRFLKGRRIILLAEQGLDTNLRRHLEAGGEAVLAEPGRKGETQLVYRAGKTREVLLPAIRETAATVLAAAAMASGLGQPISAIAAGLAAAPGEAERAVS